VTALGDGIADAVTKAYRAVSKISWEGVFYRKDIGQKAIKRMNRTPEVGIVMGSDSDLGVMDEAAMILKKFDIVFEMTVVSAHRSPERAAEFRKTVQKRGIKVIIAGPDMQLIWPGFWRLIPSCRSSGTH